MASSITGQWGPILQWPLVAIHAVITQSGKLLTFGTDPNGVQGATMYHDLWDPVTGEHHMLDHHMQTPTDIFCAAAIILPGTNKILIAGGDARPLGRPNQGVDDVNLFDDSSHEITSAPDGEMNVARWYPTVVSLPGGQVVVMGGTNFDGVGQGTPEIYTPGEGWRSLTGAADPDVAANSFYPKAWVGPSGEIFYVANGDGPDNVLDLMALDPSGNGSVREVARLPFYLDWLSPAIMYDTGKILINDFGTGLWTIDITSATPEITRVATLSQDRNYGNMTVLADGTVLLNGGTGQDNLEAYADKTALLWNPTTGTLTEMGDEAHARLYHSSSILLPDGAVLSLGGGSSSISENDYLDGQVYKPGYLFDANGNPATRPVIAAAPDELVPGETFRITVDDASAIRELTFVKTGAVTHNLNMDARGTTLSFTVIDATTIEATVPADANAITAGSWMLFAWNAAGTPSIAPIVAIEPTGAPFDGIGDVTASYILIDPAVTSLDQIDFGGVVAATQMVDRIDVNTDGALVAGLRGDDIAVRYAGVFAVAAGGGYTFYLTSNDGARLYVDGVAVLDNDGVHATTEKTVTLALTAGLHAVEVRYFDDQGAARVDLDWSGASFARRQMTFDGVSDNLLANGSLERAGTDTSYLPGWTLGSSAGIWASGREGVVARSGNAFAEVSGVGGGVLQTIETVLGAAYTLGLDVSGRPGFIASSRIEVVVNGVVVGTIIPTDALWHRYEFSFTGHGSDTIALRSPASDTDGYGALVDTVLVLGPVPEKHDDGHDHSGNHIMGTAVADTLVGTIGADHMMGVDGDDRLSGILGDDTLSGDAGDDRLVGGRGSDVLTGGTGNDTFVFSAGDSPPGGERDLIRDFAQGSDRIQLNDGARDFIGLNAFTGAAGEVRYTIAGDVTTVRADLDGDGIADIEIALTGAIGLRNTDFVALPIVDRLLIGTPGADTLRGIDGNDTLVGGNGRDLLDGGAGSDTADYSATTDAFTLDLARPTAQPTGATGSDRLVNIENLIGGSGANVFRGNAADNRLDGRDGDDMLQGRNGDDVLVGGVGADRLDGGAGSDTADYSSVSAALRIDLQIATPQGDGSGGQDTLVGIENLAGGGGNDRFDGNGGGNRLDGGNGNDRLFGGAGDDVLIGGKGNDLLSGGVGRDLLTGGAGRDIFVFNTGGSLPGILHDVITDFVKGEDVITGNVSASGFIGTRGFTGVAGEVRFAAGDDLTIVQLDANGDRVADLEFGLVGRIALVNTDFVGLPNANYAAGPVGRAVFGEDRAGLFLPMPPGSEFDGFAHVCLV